MLDDYLDNIYPPPEPEGTQYMGIYPVDFLFEEILTEGFEWFKRDPDAPCLVFGNLKKGRLAARYGQAKIDEISDFIKTKKIRILQSFPLDGEISPSISINLTSSNEMLANAGLNDYAEDSDVLGVEDSILSRSEVGYTSITDNVLIGIHAIGSPDAVKYLYMLVLYLLNSCRSDFESEGLSNLTCSATDLSRLNEYLPANMFSRFITASVLSFAKFRKQTVPMVSSISLTVDTDEGE
jgi:hypothetical protein